MIREASLVALSLITLGWSGGGASADGRTAEATAGQERELFAESVEGEPCEILTLEKVSETFDVPAEDIRQSSMMACTYSWPGGVIMLFGVRVFDDEDEAVEHLAEMAKGVTAEELAEAWDEIIERTRERAGDRQQTGTTGAAVGAVAANGAREGISFEVAPDLGDRAVWQTGGSSAKIQVANAIVELQVTARGQGLEADRRLTRRVFEAVVEEMRRRNSGGGR